MPPTSANTGVSSTGPATGESVTTVASHTYSQNRPMSSTAVMPSEAHVTAHGLR